jgi:ABC-2 type transport system ATP-binding protein
VHDPSRLTLSVPTDGSAARVRALLDDIDPERTLVAAFAVHTTTLDDVFLALTQQDTTQQEPAHV